MPVESRATVVWQRKTKRVRIQKLVLCPQIWNFFVDNTFTRIEIYCFNFKEGIMAKLLKKTHPGTIAALILIGTVAALIVIFFCF